MSVYTIQTRYICEQLARNSGLTTNNKLAIISNAIPYIFDNPITWYSDEIGPRVYNKILAHYYTHEIGLETVELWKFKMWEHLNLNAPYWNELYKSVDIEYNPLSDYNLEKWHSGEDSTKETSAADESSKIEREEAGEGAFTTSRSHSDLYSDTPQTRLSEVAQGQYISEARYITDSGTDSTNNSLSRTDTTTADRSSNSKRDGTNQYHELITGKLGGKSYQELIEESRKLILNIDQMIVLSCDPLFMQVWEV